MATQILVTSNELGVFELLRDGPRELSSLASSLGVAEASLDRLLAGCSSLDLLERRGNTFALTAAASDHLIKDKPTYLGGMLGVIGKAFYPLAGHLIDGIRENTSIWDKVPGMKDTYYSSMYRDEDTLRTFMAGMFGLTYVSTQEAVARFDFGRFRHIVDLGGAPGAFLVGVCQKFEQVRGTIFDLPTVEKVSNETLVRMAIGDVKGVIGRSGRWKHDRKCSSGRPTGLKIQSITLGACAHGYTSPRSAV